MLLFFIAIHANNTVVRRSAVNCRSGLVFILFLLNYIYIYILNVILMYIFHLISTKVPYPKTI